MRCHANDRRAGLTDETNKPAHGFVIKGRRQVAANSVFDIFFDHIAEPPDREGFRAANRPGVL